MRSGSSRPPGIRRKAVPAKTSPGEAIFVLVLLTSCGRIGYDLVSHGAESGEDSASGAGRIDANGVTTGSSDAARADGSSSATDSSALDATETPQSCNDGVRSGSETDVDCGGDCAPCENSRACGLDADCASGYCPSGACATFPCPASASCTCETNGHTYLFCSTAVDYAAAAADCASVNMRLARVDSQTENDWLLAAAEQAGLRQTFFLGGSSLTDPNVWAWTDGEPFWTGDASGQALLYSNWQGGEPGTPGEQCLQMQRDGRWNDQPCGVSLAYVCEHY